jgi:cytochrome d ubiquinol oxidase subunit I
MQLDPVLLSRLQFAFVIAFHILLPAFTVGLASYIAVLEGVYLFKRDAAYLRISMLWTKMFAVSFGMGVVSGIVLPFQLGTNWSRYADVTADVIGPLLAYEGMMAFFLEAGFLGVLLFGRKLVPPWVHFSAALLVALGTMFSSFWILAANSWMHTPAGHEIVNGRFFPVDWLQVIFNPSFPFRLAHTVTAFMVTTGFVVVGVAAYYLRHGRHIDEAKKMMSMTFWLLSLSVPLQIVLGDLHGLNTVEHQPAKIAAMEGLWETQTQAPAILFAIPDERNERNRAEIAIPGLASFYLKHDFDAEVRGMKSFSPQDRPPMTPVFYAFRVMVGIGVVMLAVVLWSAWLRRGGRLYTSRTFLGVCQAMIPVGFVAVLAGWIVTEVGRQPWIVYGLMRTHDGVSPSITGSDVLTSLILYATVYVVIYGAGLFYLTRLARAGPKDVETDTPQHQRRPSRPLSAADADL